MTWDRRLYFPSEGRRAEDFFRLKNPTASAGFEPANLGTKGQHATPRPPKPLALVIQNEKRMLQIVICGLSGCTKFVHIISLTLNIPCLARQRCLSSWGPRRTPMVFFVISQLFDAVDYSNYVVFFLFLKL